MSNPVIIPASVNMYGKTTQQFTADQAVDWTATAGVVSPTGLYTPPNVTGQYTVTATNEGAEATDAPVGVTGEYPLQPHRPLEYKIGLPGVLVQIARDGRTRTGRIVGSGELQRAFKLFHQSKRKDAAQEVQQFFKDHYPEKVFHYANSYLDVDGLFYIDADIEGQITSGNAGEFYVAIIEA